MYIHVYTLQFFWGGLFGILPLKTSIMLSPYPYRPQYFKLLDKCVSQIVLHRGGMDPDFHYTKKFQIDVDGIIGMIIEEPP